MTRASIRPARITDATHLAALVDIAGEGFAAHFWSLMAAEGQSPFEVGRARAMRNEGAFSWRNAHVVETDGQVAGALVGYVIDDALDPGGIAAASAMVRPLLELEALVAGYWYVNVLAVFSEYRGLGIGARLLGHADSLAAGAGATGLAIIVASGNDGARRLYERICCSEMARRRLTPFPGYRRGGDWVLMIKPPG